jgi:hypothetical protein
MDIAINKAPAAAFLMAMAELMIMAAIVVETSLEGAPASGAASVRK